MKSEAYEARNGPSVRKLKLQLRLPGLLVLVLLLAACGVTPEATPTPTTTAPPPTSTPTPAPTLTPGPSGPDLVGRWEGKCVTEWEGAWYLLLEFEEDTEGLAARVAGLPASEVVQEGEKVRVRGLSRLPPQGIFVFEGVLKESALEKDTLVGTLNGPQEVMHCTLERFDAAALAARQATTTWEVAASPANLGWSAGQLAEARAFADELDTAAVVIVQEGVIVDQWGDPARVYNVHSIRKSLLSALYGIAVEAGHIDLEATLGELGIDDHEALSAGEQGATVRQLLMARSGVYHPALFETPSMARLRPARGNHAPGTFWYYNNWDFNALGTIYEQETGEGIFTAFAEELAAPLGMEDFSLEDTGYGRGPISQLL